MPRNWLKVLSGCLAAAAVAGPARTCSQASRFNPPVSASKVPFACLPCPSAACPASLWSHAGCHPSACLSCLHAGSSILCFCPGTPCTRVVSVHTPAACRLPCRSQLPTGELPCSWRRLSGLPLTLQVCFAFFPGFLPAQVLHWPGDGLSLRQVLPSAVLGGYAGCTVLTHVPAVLMPPPLAVCSGLLPLEGRTGRTPAMLRALRSVTQAHRQQDSAGTGSGGDEGPAMQQQASAAEPSTLLFTNHSRNMVARSRRFRALGQCPLA